VTLTITPAEIVACAEATGAPGLLGRAAHWPRVPLGSVAKVVNGAPYPSGSFNRGEVGWPLIRIRDIGQSGVSTWYSGEFEKMHIVRRDDLLIGMDGDFRAALWRGPLALLNQRVCRVDVDEAAYSKRFLTLVLPGYLDAINVETSSVTVKHLSSKTVCAVPLPAPPLEEQHRIAAVVTEALLAAEHSFDDVHLISRLRTFRLSALKEHFDALRVNFASRALGDVAQTALGKMLDAKRTGGVPTPYLRNINVRWGHVNIDDVRSVGAHPR